MKNKIIAFIITIILVVALTAYFLDLAVYSKKENSNETNEPVEQEIYESAKQLSFKEEDNYLIAVLEEDKYKEMYDDTFETVDLGGEDKFLIVPKYNNMEIKIYELTLNDEGNMDEKYLKTMNKSFYLTCNPSDLYSNVAIKVEYNNKKIDYSPFYSLKDGSLSTNENILFYTK